MWCDVLQAAVTVTNSFMLKQEIRDLKMKVDEHVQEASRSSSSCSFALFEYFKSGWNVCNFGGIVALYVAVAAHFTDEKFILEQVGAIGVLLNAFSLLELLQPFELTGALIHVITETTKAVTGWVLVMLVLIWGFAASFAVSMPTNVAFITTNATVLPGLLTTAMAMVGDFDVDQYEHVGLWTFIVFLFLVIIVMFNVLIAIVSEIYDTVMSTTEVDVRIRRAEVIIHEEALLSTADLREVALMAEQDPSISPWFPEYLEVLEVVDSGVIDELSELSQVDSKIEALAERMQVMGKAKDEQVGDLQKAMDEMHSMMAQMLEHVQRTA